MYKSSIKLLCTKHAVRDGVYVNTYMYIAFKVSLTIKELKEHMFG